VTFALRDYPSPPAPLPLGEGSANCDVGSEEDIGVEEGDAADHQGEEIGNGVAVHIPLQQGCIHPLIQVVHVRPDG